MSDQQLDLFGDEGLRVERPPVPVDTRTAGERRIARQRAAVEHGHHPLHLVSAYGLRLHADARRDFDRTSGGPRCGGCRFRVNVNTGHARSFPKCLWTPAGDLERPWPRETNGEGTDVRAYWPACTDYQPAGG